MRSHFFFWFCFFEQEDIVDYNRSVTVFILIPPPPPNQTVAYRQLQTSFMCSVVSCGRYSRCEELLKSSKARRKGNTEAGLDKIQDLAPQ